MKRSMEPSSGPGLIQPGTLPYLAGVGMVSLVGVILAGGAIVARADADPARYNSIVEINPFRLKPPPPPVDPASTQPPPPPPQLATVKLTGVTSILSSKRACLEIIPGPGKQMAKVILSEGEKAESVEVVTIDVEKSQVVIKNGPVTTNLTFEVVKSTAPAGPAGGVPGVVPPMLPGGVPPNPAAQPQPNFSYSQPTAGRSGVIMAGGTQNYEPAAAASAGNLGLTPTAATATSALNPSAAGVRSIPSRPMRGAGLQAGQPTQAPTMSPEAAQIDMEQKRRNYPNLPFPPTLLSPRTGQLPPLPGQQQDQ